VKDHFGEVDEVDAVVVLVLEEVEQLLNLGRKWCTEAVEELLLGDDFMARLVEESEELGAP
jgi:hypothetical protein